MKSTIKVILFAACVVLVSPLVVALFLNRLLSNERQFFMGCSQLLSIVPLYVGVYLRAAFYKLACNNVDREHTTGFLTVLTHTDIDIGKYVYIGAQCNIGSCSIGRDSLLGSGVHILSGKNQHTISDNRVPIRLQGGHYQKITIGENCWIGSNSTVMAHIGENSVVAAGSVVIDDVAPGTVVGGNPAKMIKSR